MLFRTSIEEKNKVLTFLHKHIIAIVVIVAVIAAGISSIVIIKNSISDNNHVEGVTYADTNTLRFAMTRVDTLNPLISDNEDVYAIATLVYDSLFSLDDNLNIRCNLALSYDADASNGTVSIKLKKDVKFHDGSELTASDVKYTVDAIKYAGSRGPYYDYASKIAYIDVKGSKSLVIHFYNPYDAALDNLVFPIVPDSQYGSPSSFVNQTSFKPIGTGRYKYKSYNYLSFLKLSPNKDYFGDAPSNNIRFVILPSKSHVTDLMTMDDITVSLIKKDNIDSVAQDKHLHSFRITSNKAEYMGFNFNNQYMAMKEVRHAIAMAIDLKQMLTEVYMGDGILSDTIFYPGFMGVSNSGDSYKFDLNSAIKELKNAGFEDTNEDGYVEDAEGNAMEFTILVNSNNITRCEAAERISEALKYIGLNVTVVEENKDTYNYKLNSGQFDMYLGGCTFEKRYNLKNLLGYGNNLHYNSEEAVKYLNKLETCMSASKYTSTFEKLKKVLVDDMPYYCLYYKNYSLTSVRTFTYKEVPTFFDQYRYCETWDWEKVVRKSDEEGE